MSWLDGLETLPKLSVGSHNEGERELCAMELVAFMERLPHSDSPPCTCPVLAAYVRVLNDRMDDATRQLLLPYLPRLVGTVDKAQEAERARRLAMAAVNIFAAMDLEAKGMHGHAKACREASDLDAANAAAADAAAANAVANAAYAAYYAANAAADAVNAADAADAAACAAACAAADAAVWESALIVLGEMLPDGKTVFARQRAEEAAGLTA